MDPASPSRPRSKRLRSSSPPQLHEFRREALDSTAELPHPASFHDLQEWRESLQADAMEQGKEDAESEAAAPFVRLQDLDENMTRILAGIASTRPTEALREFRELLTGDGGGKVLQQYVLLSPKCTEITSAWSLAAGAEWAVPLLLLVRELMRHSMGNAASAAEDSSEHGSVGGHRILLTVRVRLDKLARFIISSKIKDIYAHLSSTERSRQNAALLLMASIVRRGSMLASQVATTFDFTLSALPKLSKAPKNLQQSKMDAKRENALKLPTRVAFIEFALSFLEVCHAALLRWVLQIRPLYAGVLHKLASDDETTIVTVLKVMQNKVLDSAAMVPAGLQSALFGDTTLEQLAIISSNSLQPEAAQMSHETLLVLCTDSSHGICPEASLSWGATTGKTGNYGGGQGRLVRLMLKLKATQYQNHRELLLSIAAGRPVLVSAYLKSFPYSLEPRASAAWFAAVLLVSDIISVTKVTPPFASLAAQGLPPPAIDTSLTQSILRSAVPGNWSRLLINRGLLHVSLLVKHACLRVLLEMFLSVEFYLNSIFNAHKISQQKHTIRGMPKQTGELMSGKQQVLNSVTGVHNMCANQFEGLKFTGGDIDALACSSVEDLFNCQTWLALGRYFQYELRSLMPDPQVLFSMLSLKPVNIEDFSVSKRRQKRVSAKGIASNMSVDLLTVGDAKFGDSMSDAMDYSEDQEVKLEHIWNADPQLIQTGDLKNIGSFLNAKLLEVLACYQRIIPMVVVESSYDIYRLVPEEPLSLSWSQQRALLTLLSAATEESSVMNMAYASGAGDEIPHFGHLYRHLKPLIKLMFRSKDGWIKENAQRLAHRAMISCGAFENNNNEIGVWFQFLPSWDDGVISLFCDAVSTVGRNIDKHLDVVVSIIRSDINEGYSPTAQFGPLVVSVLEKCLRVLASSTKKLRLPQQSSIAFYVANTLELLLQVQAYPKVLGFVIKSLLSAGLKNSVEPLENVGSSSSDWIALRSLWVHVQCILRDEDRLSFWECSAYNLAVNQSSSTGSLAKALEVCKTDENSSVSVQASALSSCLLCVSVQEIVENMPSLMGIFFQVFKGRNPVLVALFGAYKWLLPAIAESWPDFFNESMALTSSLADSNKNRCKNLDLLGQQGEQVAPGNLQDLNVEDKLLSSFSTSSRITIFSFSAFLLSLPFAIIFPAAANSHEGQLLRSDSFKSVLEAALSEVPPGNWLSTATLILFWIRELWVLHQKGSDVECQLETCFSFLKYVVVPSKDRGWWALLQTEEDTCSELPVIKDLITRVVEHPLMMVHHRVCEELIPGQLPSQFEYQNRNSGPLMSDGLDSWFHLGKSTVSLMDRHVIDILKELLQWASHLPKANMSAAVGEKCNQVKNVILASCKPFLSQTFAAMKNVVIQSRNNNLAGILPSLTMYTAHTFCYFVDIHSLLDLACTLLSQESSFTSSYGCSSAWSMPYLFVGLYFATSAFDRLTNLCVQTESDGQDASMWPRDLQYMNLLKDSLVQELYEKVVQLVLMRPSERVFSCFLSALKSQCSYTLDQCLYISPKAVLSPCLYKTPMQIFRPLLMNVDETKAKIVFLLVQVSQFYLSAFSQVLSCNLGCTNDDLAGTPVFRHLSTILCASELWPVSSNANYSLKDKVVLLPAAHQLITKVRYREQSPLCGMVTQVTSVYAKVIIEILQNWDAIINNMDMLEAVSYVRSTQGSKDLSKLLGLTTLGQVVLLLKHCLTHHHLNFRERTHFVRLLFEKSYPFLDSLVASIDMSSLENMVKLVIVTIAKAMMAKLLISVDTSEEGPGENAWASESGTGSILEMETEKIGESTCQFPADSFSVADMLVQTLGVLFQQKARGTSEDGDSDCVVESLKEHSKVSKHMLFKFLEMTLLKILKDISRTPIDTSQKAQYMSLLKKFTKMVLRYRFGEPLPMNVLRCLASRLVQIPTFAAQYGSYALDLLVGHSHFVSTLLSSGTNPKHNVLVGRNSERDTSARSLSSVLYLLRSPLCQHLLDDPKHLDCLKARHVEAEPEKLVLPLRVRRGISAQDKKFEVIKLLRLLYRLKCQANGFEISSELSSNSDELLSLLLAAYGASMSEVDKENLLLMHEIESYEGAGFLGLAGLDYLWGEAALKRRKTKLDGNQGSISFQPSDKETATELRKRWFKEDILLDPIRCGLSVLFPALRRKFFSSGAVSLTEGFDEEQGPQNIFESDEKVLTEAAYDPSFILPFASHSVSSGWLDAEDFVSKGLLAMAFVSIAFVEEGMRKLGYEVLAKFFTALEEGPSFKAKPQIRLLLTFVKNAITEPWQRLPFVVALFAAEASCILMNPSDVHYPVVNKFCFRGPGIDLETAPLFKAMFGSGSVHFRTDRAWILRLLAFGLRTSLDTHIYRSRFIMEILMSFYSSPLGDRHTREWILQILHRATKIRSYVQYLIEHTGLLSWLTSIILSNGAAKSGEYAAGISVELAVEALQVCVNALSWKSVKRWLMSDGFEDLSKMALSLHLSIVQKSALRSHTFFRKHTLRILGIALSLSRGRKKFQSHLDFSLKDFIEIVQFLEMEETMAEISEMRLLTLRTILESSPPACCLLKDKMLLYQLGTWAVSLVLKSDSDSSYVVGDAGDLMPNRGVDPCKTRVEVEGLKVTVLRWMAASLILGKLKKGVAMQYPSTARSFVNTANSMHINSSMSEAELDKDLLKFLINLQCYLGTSVATNASVLSVVGVSAVIMPTIESPSCGASIGSSCPKQMEDLVDHLLSEVSCPEEVNIAWRWMPWNVRKDLSLRELEACQMLLAIFQSILHGATSDVVLGMVGNVKDFFNKSC